MLWSRISSSAIKLASKTPKFWHSCNMLWTLLGTRVIHLRIAPTIFSINESSIIQNGAENADARLEYLRTYIKLKTVKWSLKAGRLIETIKRENKHNVVSYICPLFWFSTQTFNWGYKRKMNTEYKTWTTGISRFCVAFSQHRTQQAKGNRN